MTLNLPEEWRLPDNLKRLPLIVTPREHEPAESILFRLAIANGYSSIERLLRGTPNFPPELRAIRYSRNKYIALVARLGGLSESLIDAITPYRNSGGMTLYGHHFGKIRSVGKARVCPGCLAEDTLHLATREQLRPYRRNWWEIQNIGACPIHAVRLIDCCPTCSKQLRLIDSPVLCVCNRSLDLRHPPTERLSDEHLIHDRWILGRLGICDVQEHAILDSMPIDIGSRLCLVIGMLLENNFRIPGGRIAAPAYSVNARAAGWHVLAGWPESFDLFLDNLVSANSSARNVRSIRAARYGGLVGSLQLEEAPELEVVLQAIRAHVQRHHLVSPTTRIAGQSIALGEKIALEAAADMIGCGQVQFLKIAKALDLPDGLATDVGTPAVPTSHVEAVRDFFESSIRTSEVGKLLSCNSKVIVRLVNEGVLRLKLKGNVSVTDLLDRADVERLLAIVSVPLEEVRELGEEHLTVRRASRIALFGEAGILMALASGHLQAVGRLPGVAGFKGMIFNRSDLVEAIQLVTGKRLYGRVLNEKGWKTGTLRYLRENGFLDADLHTGYVDVRELNAFLARHVDMREMLEWEMPPLTRREIRSILNAEGVAPVIPLGSHVSAFWPRSRARQALGARSS